MEWIFEMQKIWIRIYEYLRMYWNPILALSESMISRKGPESVILKAEFPDFRWQL